MENPFIIRGYAGPEYFCDREKETAAFVEALRNGRDVTLVAPRRYGKTGLIHNAFGKLGQDFSATYLDIFAIEDLTTFVRKFSSAILGRLDSRTERMGKKVLSFFMSCRPTYEWNGDSGSNDTHLKEMTGKASSMISKTYARLSICRGLLTSLVRSRRNN